MCNCFEEINKQLEKYNTRAMSSISVNVSSGQMEFHGFKIATERIDARKREGPVTLLVTFCPICGENVGETQASVSTEKD